MKLTFFGLLAFCLVLTNAGVVDPIEEATRTLEGYSETLNGLAAQVVNDFEHKYDEIVLQPLAHVEASVKEIEELKQESDYCVEAQESEIQSVIATVEDSINVCGQTATVKSAGLGYEIAKVSIGLVFDTIDLIKTYKKCQKYKNQILAKTCYTKATIKATKLLFKTKKAIKQLTKSVDETLPQVVLDLEDCSAVAEETALFQLEVIHNDVDKCIASYKKSNSN